MTSFLFEWKKIIKKKTTWVLILLSIGAVIGIYFLHVTVTNNVQKKVINHYDFLVDLYLQDTADWALEKEKARMAEDKEWEEDATIMEESSQSQYEHYQLLKESYQEEEWEVIFQNELEILEPFINPKPDLGVSAYIFENQEIKNFTLRASYEEMQYLLDHGIQPFVQYNSPLLLSTAYDNFSGRSLELWKESTKRYAKHGIYYMYLLIKSLYIPIIILVGCFIFGNAFSLETTKRNNHIRFYQVLPVHQTKLFFTKYLTGYFGTLVFMFIMLCVPLLVGTMIHGLGDMDYPILIYDGYTTESMERNVMEDTFHFMTIQKYFLQSIVLAICMSLLIYSMYFLISQYSKEPILNMIIIGLLSFVSTFISHPYNPFSYLDTDKVITHEIQLQTWNTDFTFITGIVVTLVASLIIIALNFLGFTYKKIRFEPKWGDPKVVPSNK